MGSPSEPASVLRQRWPLPNRGCCLVSLISPEAWAELR